MTTLQIQAKALGDPTRFAIFELIAHAGHPTDVAQLTDALSLNHNAIRQHLTKLVDADLLIESTARPEGRGRPRLLYRVNPSVESRWGVVGPYERLALLLTEILQTGEQPVEVGRRAGTRLGHPGDGDPVASFQDQIARQGFEPLVRRRRDGHLEVVLQTCPFAHAVLNAPDTVCQLHLGMAQGMAEAVGGISVDDLVVNDPRQARCRLHCHVEPAEA